MKLYEVRNQITPKDFERRKNGSLRVCTLNTEPQLAEQQHAEAADVNNIIAQYKKTGRLPELREKGVYADLSVLPKDYAEAVNTIAEAEKAFMQLPAALRIEFDNDPEKLLEFTSNPLNNAKGVELGLYKASPPTPTPSTAKTPSTDSSKTESKKPSKNDNSNDE